MTKELIMKLFLSFLGFFPFFSCVKDSKKDESLQVPKVTVIKAQKTELAERITFAGTVSVKDLQQIYSPFRGVISKIFVKLGDDIQKGQSLLEIYRDHLEHDYQRYTLKANQGGTLLYLFAKTGDRVEESSKLVHMAPLKNFEVTVYATSADIPFIQIGMSMQIGLQDFNSIDEHIKASVLEISPTAHAKSHLFPVTLKLECVPQEYCLKHLKLDSVIRAQTFKNKRMSYKFPLEVLKKNRTQVIVISQDKKALWKDIELGTNFGNEIEIKKGVEEGEFVVKSSSRGLKEGEVVIFEGDDPKKPTKE